MKTRAYAAVAADRPLEPWSFERRDVGPHDVLIEVAYCGICHSDIHQARGEWKNSTFPMVPGHEIVGRVARVGERVTKVKVGDVAGVGCMVDSCGACAPCREGNEQFCEKGAAWTYNSTEMDWKTPTYGGYSSRVVVTERFVVKTPGGWISRAPRRCSARVSRRTRRFASGIAKRETASGSSVLAGSVTWPSSWLQQWEPRSRC